MYEHREREPTVECKTNKLQTHITQADIEASGSSARPNPSKIEHMRHKRFVILCCVALDVVVVLRVCDAIGTRS